MVMNSSSTCYNLPPFDLYDFAPSMFWRSKTLTNREQLLPPRGVQWKQNRNPETGMANMRFDSSILLEILLEC
eukprot:4472439-Pleurochrysis_carterae.AAC.1